MIKGINDRKLAGPEIELIIHMLRCGAGVTPIALMPGARKIVGPLCLLGLVHVWHRQSISLGRPEGPFYMLSWGRSSGRSLGRSWAGLGDGLRAGLGDGLGDGLDLYGRTWPGQVDTCWLAFYRFGSMIGCPQRENLLQRLDIMERIAASCGFWFPRDGVCIVSDRFASVSWDNSRNRQGMPTRLHHDTKHAVSFRDGWGLYYWHGLRMPPSHEWLFSDRSKLTAEKIDKEANVELRRVMFEIYGADRYLAERDAKLIAADELHGQPRRILEVTIAGEPIRIVEVINGSLEPDGTRRKFHLGAARQAGSRALPKTPAEAIANSYGVAPAHYCEAVRT